MTNSSSDRDPQNAESEASAPPAQDASPEGAASEAAAPETAPSEAPSEEAPGENAAGQNGQPENEEEPATEAGTLRAELEALREEYEETNDRLLRTAAELQNVRRRAAKEQQRRATQARASALRPMLEVLDDLQRALAAAEDESAGDAPGSEQSGGTEGAFQSLKSGVEMVENKFESALAGLGVEPIAAEGEPFDETLHEAMMQQPAPEGTDPGTVLAEIRRGYRMETSDDEDRVLRHSRVVVAVEPEEESASAGENSNENEASDE